MAFMEDAWMERHFDERLDPRKFVPGAKSVISVVLNYFPRKEQRLMRQRFQNMPMDAIIIR